MIGLIECVVVEPVGTVAAVVHMVAGLLVEVVVETLFRVVIV